MFYVQDVKDVIEPDVFSAIVGSVQWEQTGKGRWGATVVDEKLEQGAFPLVRTTTKYNLPNQLFKDIHRKILSKCQISISTRNDDNDSTVIPKITERDIQSSNNFLIEKYDETYPTMGYHCDQALDLKEKSWIGIFSCYNVLCPKQLRILQIKHKETKEMFQIPLEPFSFVYFSTETNSQYLHRIVLDAKVKHCPKIQWIGITCRRSKTFVFFQNELAYFTMDNELKEEKEEKEEKEQKDYVQLTLANAEQLKDFYRFRSQENAHFSTYIYPPISYTINPGDLIVPI
jgi:hypothetical protein